MPIATLMAFLDDNHVKYVKIGHSKAYTSSEIAESAHIPRKELAKTVIVNLDGKLAMAVLPGSRKVVLELLRNICRLNGLGEAHLGWPGQNLLLLRHHLLFQRPLFQRPSLLHHQ